MQSILSTRSGVVGAGLFFLSLSSLAASAPCDFGAVTRSTPYDQYLAPVKTVLHQLSSESSMPLACELLARGHRFTYRFSDPYAAHLPKVTESSRAGDCKDKALWLAARMNDSSIRFVIGKARRNSRLSHAWLLWEHDARWWILDPTNAARPIAAEKVSPREYIPLFSYSSQRSYRHAATILLARNSGAQRPVAAWRR